MSEIERLTARVTDFSSKVDFWNNGVLIFLVMTALAAAGIVICQRLAFVRAGQMASAQGDLDAAKEHEAKSERDRVRTELANAESKAKEADARIAEAQRGSAEANARATKAQESLGLAEQHSAEANAKAEGFRLDIAKANERAATANETAERERLARLQLEARLADRIITPDQERRLKLAFSRLKGQTVDVGIFGETSEVAFFSGAIIRCMTESGVLLNQVRPSGGAAVKGVLMGVKANSPEVISQVATAVTDILRESGGGVGPWDFDKLMPGGGMMGVSSTAGAGKLWDSPLRIFIGGK